MSTLPTAVEMYHFYRKLLDRFYVINEEDKRIISIIISMVTGKIDEIQFRDDASIWVKPEIVPRGDRSQLMDMGDRNANMTLVKSGDFYRLAMRPEFFLHRVSMRGGCNPHQAQRLDTAKVLGVESVDDVSYPFYFGVRKNLLRQSPFEDYLNDPSEFNDKSIPGLSLPSLIGADHPNRVWLAAKYRHEVLQRSVSGNPDATIDDLDEWLRSLFLEQTNAFWWIGFHTEFMLVEKLCHKRACGFE